MIIKNGLHMWECPQIPNSSKYHIFSVSAYSKK